MLSFGEPKTSTVSAVLREMQEAVEECAARDGWNPMLRCKVNLVLEELATNVLYHGATADRPHPRMEVRITCGRQTIGLEFSDNGLPFNPLEDAPEPPDDGEVSIGGMGIRLVINTMDTLRYSRRNGRNTLNMTIART